MNKKTYIIVLPLLVLAVAALVGGISTVIGLGGHAVTSDIHLPNVNAHSHTGRHVSVDPRLVADLEEGEWVSVRIEMAMPPGFEWAEGPHDDAYKENVKVMGPEDWALYDQLRAERRPELLTALGSDYKEVGYGHYLNAAGLEKLRNSVLYVSRVGGPYDSFELAEMEIE